MYESAFGNAWKQAIADRTTHSPLEKLTDMDIEAERKAFRDIIKREPTEEEMVMYLNHPRRVEDGSVPCQIRRSQPAAAARLV